MILDIDENRYNRRAVQGRRRFFRSLIFMAIMCFVSYKMGYESVRSREEAYKKQVENIQADRGSLEETITSLRSDLQSANIRYDQLKAKYEEDVPSGNHKFLSDLIKQQMVLGIKTERLAYLIRSTSPPQNCSKPTVKRFVMVTPTYNGPKSGVTFADGAIEVTGVGESAVNSSGKVEAWYDPSKPVDITFKMPDGKLDKKQGLLPIYNSIIFKGKEHRFTLASSEQSFLSVTADYCDYP